MKPSEWKTHIKLAQDYKEKYGDYKRWKVWSEMYRNDYESDILPVNQIFAIGRTLIPRVYFRNPRIVVTPTRPDMWVQARIVEAVDNWLLTRIGMKKQMKRIILDTYLFGTGIGKSGFDSEFGFSGDMETSRELSPYEQELLESGWETQEDRIEYDTNILPGMPWYKRVSPKDFFLPWGALELHDSPWAVHRFVKHIDDVKAAPQYSNTADLSPTHRSLAIENKDIASTELQKRVEDAYVELWEIYDMKKGKVRVFATGHDKWLREDDLILDQLPFDSLIWNENPDSFWGTSDCKNLEPQQKELNEIRTQYQEHRKQSILKFIIKRGSLSDEAREALINGDPGALIEVEDEIDKQIQQIKPHLTNDLLVAANEIRQDIRETVGFSRNAMGEFDVGTRRTAYETSVVNQATQIRVDERRDTVADLLVQAVRRFNQYIFEYWTEEKVARIVGFPEAAQWVRFTGEQIRGEYNMVIDPDTTKAISSETRKAEAIEYGNWALSMAQMAPQLINIPELVKYITQQFEGVPEKILNINQGGQAQMPVSIEDAQMSMMGSQGGGVADADIQLLMQLMQGGVPGS